jgi:hypothetical protein
MKFTSYLFIPCPGVEHKINKRPPCSRFPQEVEWRSRYITWAINCGDYSVSRDWLDFLYTFFLRKRESSTKKCWLMAEYTALSTGLFRFCTHINYVFTRSQIFLRKPVEDLGLPRSGSRNDQPHQIILTFLFLCPCVLYTYRPVASTKIWRSFDCMLCGSTSVPIHRAKDFQRAILLRNLER